ncbi:MAG: HD domain-containing protein [Eubacteriales bacterium]
MMLDLFPYIKIPDFTDNLQSDAKMLLCLNNRQDVFDHCHAVAETNIKIAEKYNLDKTLCERAGYLHDISAVIEPADMLVLAQSFELYIDEAEVRYPFLLHQRISRFIATNVFDITDELILSAIECHTTLKANPTKYDMALFIADKLSWDQDGRPPFYNDIDHALEISLGRASLAYMEYIVENKMILFPHKWFTEGLSFLKNA